MQKQADGSQMVFTVVQPTLPALVDSELHQACHACYGVGGAGIVDVDRLLADGADINAVGAQSMTPLSIALLVNHVELCRLLLTHGANVNFVNPDGGTTLHGASTMPDCLAFAKLLVEFGANVHVLSDGRKAISYACDYGHWKWSDS